MYRHSQYDIQQNHVRNNTRQFNSCSCCEPCEVSDHNKCVLLILLSFSDSVRFQNSSVSFTLLGVAFLKVYDFQQGSISFCDTIRFTGAPGKLKAESWKYVANGDETCGFRILVKL